MEKKPIYTAGMSLILMAIVAIFAYGVLHESLVDLSDAEWTFTSIRTNSSSFTLEIFLWLIILILDILVSWALFKIYSLVNRDMSLLSALFRLIYTVMLGIAIYSLILAQLSSTPQLMILHLQGFELIWGLGLILFGIHLLILGFIGLKSMFPKFISWLLVIAGFAYMLIHSMNFAMPQLQDITSLIESILMLPMIAGELGLAIWLLIRGKKTLLNAA